MNDVDTQCMTVVSVFILTKTSEQQAGQIGEECGVGVGVGCSQNLCAVAQPMKESWCWCRLLFDAQL
jgi:hypothetical protein